MNNHTQGAIRAGREISKRFRKALPKLPEENAETLAAIIDAETAAPELLAALERMLSLFDNGKAMSRLDWGKSFLRAEDIRELNEAPLQAGAAIRKARGK